ncbi:MAG: DUF3253 domain-containing protein [Anaerolineales bacterium]|nr:DUF3253 domain-containing protein [Anaerolineales bacterium]MCB0015282.1 DUF3253 domain-containing protein [Anaerolineales bacterium]MCB0028883.1 DUF3253 domain-containing protein [Anaerolineales bacterium]
MNEKPSRLHKQQKVKKKKKRLDEPVVIERIMALCHAVGPTKSITPQQVAAALDEEDWHSYLRPVRVAAAKLARDGRIEILRKGKPVDPDDFKGVIRLRLSSRDEEE